MRILITEEALASGSGHWPSYLGDLAIRFRARGDEVDVLTHRRATSEVLSRTGGTPWYSRNCWVDPRSQGKFGGLLHNWHFHRETIKWVKEHGPYDRILALTMRMQHLLAYAALCRSARIPESTRFVLLFVQGFGRYAGPGEKTTFTGGFSSRLARGAFRAMAPAVESGRVILAGETGGMCDELQRFSGLPAKLFPHPVEGGGRRSEVGGQRSEVGGRRSVGGKAEIGEGRSTEQELTITCPGFGRHEKGTDLLHDAILEVLDQPWAERLRFVMQWPEPFGMPDGGTMSPDPRLVADARVEFLNENLDAEAYSALLGRSDLVILPYRSESYHQRLSRVAIEAAREGIPLIYTLHTWTQEVADLVGGGIPIAEETPRAIIASLREALDRYAELRASAAKGAAGVRSFHTAESFRDCFA